MRRVLRNRRFFFSVAYTFRLLALQSILVADRVDICKCGQVHDADYSSDLWSGECYARTILKHPIT